ncbi:MAG TPA: glycosyltransferase family 4 protein [Acidisarcina sp.]
MNILVVHNHIPKPDLCGSDVRLRQLLKALREANHRVTLVALWDCESNHYIKELESQQIVTYAGDMEHLRSFGNDLTPSWSLQAILTQEVFDVAVLTLWFWNCISVPELYFNDIRSWSPSTKIGVLTDDQQGRRQEQLAEVLHSYIGTEIAADYALRESQIYGRSDFVITIASAEAEAIALNGCKTPVVIIPFGTAVEVRVPGYEERADLLFLANFSNYAAEDAISWFLAWVWPLVLNALPQVRLTIAGPFSEECTHLSAINICRLGYVPNLRDLFGRHRIFVSPMRFGTGLVTKNITAMSWGVPVVTTRSGSISLEATNDLNITIRDNPSDIAEAITRIYADSQLWHALSREASAHISVTFSLAAIDEGIERMVQLTETLTNQPFASEVEWSCNRIAKLYPELAKNTGEKRVLAFLLLAESLLAMGEPQSALVQFRHACSVLGESSCASFLYPRLLRGLSACYSECGDFEALRRCNLEQKAQGLSRPVGDEDYGLGERVHL